MLRWLRRRIYGSTKYTEVNFSVSDGRESVKDATHLVDDVDHATRMSFVRDRVCCGATTIKSNEVTIQKLATETATAFSSVQQTEEREISK